MKEYSNCLKYSKKLRTKNNNLENDLELIKKFYINLEID